MQAMTPYSVPIPGRTLSVDCLPFLSQRGRSALAFDPSLQVCPNVLRHGRERCNDCWIKLASSTRVNLLPCCAYRPRHAIWSVRCNGVQAVGDRHNPCSYWYFVALQVARIAASVVILVMAIYDLCCLGEERDATQNLVSTKTVLAHDCDFFGVELTGF